MAEEVCRERGRGRRVLRSPEGRALEVSFVCPPKSPGVMVGTE